MSDDAPTTIVAATRPSGAQSGDLRARVPALTIMWHPDVDRVGRTAALSSRLTEVSRYTLPFDPVADVALSRSPFLLVDYRGGAATVQATATKTSVSVDGVPLLTSRNLSEDMLRRGVTLALSDKIVVCLHHLRTPVLRGPKLDMVGTSDAIEDVRRQIEKVASLSVPVSIRGESGTGKELVARAIAAASGKVGPYVAVNMANIQASTAITMLFGHEKSSFTGAGEAHSGYFVQADGGTLFLDEIGAMFLDLQRMLLRAVETGEISPLGSRKYRKVTVRILYATDKNLEAAVDAGQFDGALLNRINEAYRISLPPLRDRREDLGSLFLHFLRKELNGTQEISRISARSPHERPWLGASEFVRIALASFPGNIRSLIRVVRQIAVSSRGQPFARLSAEVDDLLAENEGPPPVSRPPISRSSQPTDDEIDEALRATGYNHAAAADQLGVSRTTLYRRLRAKPGAVRTADAVPEQEILQSFERHKGDISTMASELRVSPKPLKTRLAALIRKRPRP